MSLPPAPWAAGGPPTPLCRPLDWQCHLRQPSRRWPWLVLVNLLVLSIFFVLAFSPLLTAPGVAVALPTVSSQALGSRPAQAVLSLREGRVVLLQGAVVPPAQLREQLRQLAVASREVAPVLLLKVDRHVDLQEAMEVWAEARAAGFAEIQVAAEAERPVALDGLTAPRPR